VELDFDACYCAFESRDARFDGRFFIGVRTTGVYCRPICPAPMPRPENVRFYPFAAAAAAAGLRPCKRCRAEAAPGSPAWLGGPAVVAQAVRLIEGGFLDRSGVAALATEVSVGERQLRRLFNAHVGASPAALAAARRLSTARLLIDQTDFPLARVAFEAGYTSVRQFNAAIRAAFGIPPSRLRGGPSRPPPAALLELRIAFRPPLDWERLLAYLALRATPGVEAVEAGSYRRSFRTSGGGILEVLPPAEREVTVRLYGAADAAIAPLVRQIRHLLDLNADPWHVEQALAADARLGPLLADRPGVRIPGCIDGFELAVRAILGQQVSVRAATSVAGRLAGEYGTPLAEPRFGLRWLFPGPEELADAELPWLPRARGAAIRALAREVLSGGLSLAPGADFVATVAALKALPGVGPWTASYVALRALGDPDAFPEADLGLRKSLQDGRESLPAAAEVAARAEAWRPWRGYAAMLLWQDDVVPDLAQRAA
jgi:AraC family transcriptional regulator of adaptative response / DNA-3-methyladenine glycosylase II